MFHDKIVYKQYVSDRETKNVEVGLKIWYTKPVVEQNPQVL